MGDRSDLLDAHTGKTGSSCFVKRCGVRNCKIALPQSAICINCDRCDAFSEATRRPDFIVFFDIPETSQQIWMIIEVKGRLDQPQSILAQIRAGATTIEQHPLFRLETPTSRLLVPLVLFDGQSRAAEFALFGRESVQFHSRTYIVRAIRCRPNLSLEDLIRPLMGRKGT